MRRVKLNGIRGPLQLQREFQMQFIQCIATHRFQPGWARVISGSDEGVFGWIALNYQTAHLSVNPILAQRAASGGGGEKSGPSPLRRAGPRNAGVSLPAFTHLPQHSPSLQMSSLSKLA